ncbi:MAG TPA: restriction endonuclease, partial [Verrucomicrobiae bacterium]|nr:restriction endonuclease [Verrucomicrobiae bacterium]
LTEWTAPIFGIIPVWSSIPVALLGWVAIYFYWTMKISAATPLNQFGWLLGAAFAGATLAAGYRGFQFRRNREKFVADRLNLSVLKQLSEEDFGKLLANFHRQDGCTVEELAAEGADRGIDLVLWKYGQKTIVHYQDLKSCKVGVEKVRELFGIQAHEGAAKAVLITRGIFTEPALSFAAGKPMELIDGAQLAELAHELQKTIANLDAR